MGTPSPSPDKDALGALETLVPARDNRAPSTTSISFDGLLDPPLLLHEDLKEGCGGQLWPAGMVLAKFMLQHHSEDLAGKAILELGSGGGLVGLAVAKGCQTTFPVVITDQAPMLNLMRQNIALNSLQASATAEILDWGSSLSRSIENHCAGLDSGAEESYPDVVLAADCVYFEPAFPLLLHTLHRLLGPRTVCYFCFKKRRKADWRFVKELKKKFEVVDVAYGEQDNNRRDGIYLYQVRKSCRKA